MSANHHYAPHVRRFQALWNRSPFIWVLLIANISARFAGAATIYWADGTGIQRTSNDGQSIETLVSDPNALIFSIAIDEENGWLYWSDVRAGTINRSYLDGSMVKTIILDSARLPSSIFLDADGGDDLYWRDAIGSRIHRENADGTNEHVILDPSVTPPFVGEQLRPVGLAVDFDNGYLYLPAIPRFLRDSFILRTNLDGSNIEEVFHFQPDPWVSQVILDRSGGKLFALRNGNDVFLGASIWRMDRDGTNAEQVLEVGVGEIVWDLVEGADTFYLSMGFNLNSPESHYGIYTTDTAFSPPTLLFELEKGASSLAVDFGIPGDANGDAIVNIADFNVVKANFGTGAKRSQGDFNGDHAVDLADFNILKTNFASEGNPVPEPASAALAMTAILAALALLMARQGSAR